MYTTVSKNFTPITYNVVRKSFSVPVWATVIESNDVTFKTLHLFSRLAGTSPSVQAPSMNLYEFMASSTPPRHHDYLQR